MSAELQPNLIADDQSCVPPRDKMEDDVVVVVDSGQLKSETTTIIEEDSTQADHESGEGYNNQATSLAEEKYELIKVPLEGEQSAAREAIANANNETENHGLTEMETDERLVTEDNDIVEQPRNNESAYDIKEAFDSTARSKSSSFDVSSSTGSKTIVTNSAEEELLASSSGILQSSNPSNFQDANASGAGEEEIEGKNLEVAIMSELENIVKDDVENEEEESMQSDVKMDDARGQDFVCEECGKKFTHISSKKRHMLKHKEGESPVIYQCLACSKTFQYNSSLKRHLKLHSEETPGKAYTCKECSKAFMYATSLKRHLKTHSGKEIYPCPQCQRCFEYISSLKRHSKLHTEGKGFKCDICSKAFGYLSSLTRHQRVHQKSLTCTKCNKEFRLYKSYVKHLEQHGEILDEAELAAMKVEESDGGEDEDEEMETKDESGNVSNKDGVAGELDESEVSASMVATSIDEANEKSQLDAIHGDVIDLQSAENHPFVKFVVSQNTVTLEQLQAFQASQATNNAEGAQSQDSIAYAVVHADGNAAIDDGSVVSNDLSGTPVGGIVLVEFDQNNKVTERHMEGLQASNLLQLLQAVEGFAVESNTQSQQEAESQQKEDMNGEDNQAFEKQPEQSDEMQGALIAMGAEEGQVKEA